MSEFIFVGIIVILAVNGVYSRFCEQSKGKRRNFRKGNTIHGGPPARHSVLISQR